MPQPTPPSSPWAKLGQFLTQSMVPELPAGSRRLLAARIVFWLCFLTVAGASGHSIWNRMGPWEKNPIIVSARTHYHLWRLTSKNPKTAARSWEELYRLYMTSWQAFHILVPHFWDEDPIHCAFSQGWEYRGSSQRLCYWAEPHACAGSSLPICCRTRGDALLAIAYRDDVPWRTLYQGDWQRWWRENLRSYPFSVRLNFNEVERPEPRARVR